MNAPMVFVVVTDSAESRAFDPVVYEIMRQATGMTPEMVDQMDPIYLDGALQAIVYHA